MSGSALTDRLTLLLINTPHPSRYRVVVEGVDLTAYFHFTNRRNRPPLDLGYVASMVHRSMGQNIGLALLEANARRLSVEETVREATKSEPDIVVLNTTAFDRWICPYPSIESPSLLLRALRSSLPDAKLVVIGPHVTVFPQRSMVDMPEADMCVIGEPEGPVSRLVSSLTEGEEVPEIAGTATRFGDEVRVNPPGPLGSLDDDPIPLYPIMPLDPYQRYGYYKSELYRFKGLSTFILSSRGCPFRCGFCALYVHRRGFRSRSPGNVVDEIEMLSKEHGVGIVRFQDPEFSIDRRRTVSMCEMLVERGIHVAWSAETRYSSVDPDLLQLMKRSGCYQLNYGLESGSQVVLDCIDKKQTVDEAEQAIGWTSEAGIHCSNNLIFGLPGEDPSTIGETLRFAEKMSVLPKVTFARASLSVPYPATTLYEMGVQDGKFEPISSWREFPRVLAASGQIRTAFKDIRQVAGAIRSCNNKLRQIQWAHTFGSTYWASPRYYRQVALPALLRRVGLRASWAAGSANPEM